MVIAAAVALLILFGLALMGVELFILPGFGVVGVVGLVALAGALAGAWLYLSPGEAAGAATVGLAGGGALLWFLPRTRLAQDLVLRDVQTVRAADPALGTLLGARGHVLTPLRPSGTVEFAGRPVDVVSEGQFVEAGARVRVVQVEGARVVVEPVKDFEGA